MASSSLILLNVVSLLLVLLATNLHIATCARTLAALVEEPPKTMTYHKGELLSGPHSVSLIWYGKFTTAQRAIVIDFVTSLKSNKKLGSHPPSVSSWFKTIEKYYTHAKSQIPILTLGDQILDESCSLGKQLTSAQIASLAGRGRKKGVINMVLTADDVVVDGFCRSRCGTHDSISNNNVKFTYIWVGNSATQCPGKCAWPFHRPIYGPQTAPLVAPNGDVGVDGMVINLAGLLAGTVTNPFGNGFFQGDRMAPLEAGSACPGMYGTGAYPGYAGDLLVDSTTGGSYNAQGNNGRKYLLPAVIDPSSSECSTLV